MSLYLYSAHRGPHWRQWRDKGGSGDVTALRLPLYLVRSRQAPLERRTRRVAIARRGNRGGGFGGTGGVKDGDVVPPPRRPAAGTGHLDGSLLSPCAPGEAAQQGDCCTKGGTPSCALRVGSGSARGGQLLLQTGCAMGTACAEWQRTGQEERTWMFF